MGGVLAVSAVLTVGSAALAEWWIHHQVELERGLPQSWIEEVEQHRARAAPAQPALGPVGLKIEEKR